jgi:hypothetical protein
MLDVNDVDDLLSSWRTASNVDAEDRVNEILSVDAVDFKPLVAIREDVLSKASPMLIVWNPPTCSHSLLRTRACFGNSF